jgi:hypothetical protein
LVASGAKVPPFARKGRKILVIAILAPHPLKAKMRIATLLVPIDCVGDIGSPESEALCIAIPPVHLQLLKIFLHTAKIVTILDISGLVNANVVMLGGQI